MTSIEQEEFTVSFKKFKERYLKTGIPSKGTVGQRCRVKNVEFED